MNNIDLQIQETSEPMIENAEVLQEKPDAIATFRCDDDPGGGFGRFDDSDGDNQSGFFTGLNNDSEDDTAVSSNN